jgi:hypothetical protein
MLRRMLEGRNFDPKAVAILVEAFEGIVDELYLRTPAEREKAATILISLASAQATLDAAELRDKAIASMRNTSTNVLGHDLDHSGGLRDHRVDAA